MRNFNPACPNGAERELYNQVQKLICEWRGKDAAEQTASVPELVQRIVDLKALDPRMVSRLAPHDSAEAA